MANVVPYIGSEEEKMQQETQKILGEYMDDSVVPLAAKVSAHCNRVGGDGRTSGDCLRGTGGEAFR